MVASFRDRDIQWAGVSVSIGNHEVQKYWRIPRVFVCVRSVRTKMDRVASVQDMNFILYCDAHTALIHHDILDGAWRMRLSNFSFVGGNFDLVKLDCAAAIGGKERSGSKRTVSAREDFAASNAQNKTIFFRIFMQQFGERDVQRTRNFPQDIDGRCTAGEFNLAQHGPTHTGALRQLFEG